MLLGWNKMFLAAWQLKVLIMYLLSVSLTARCSILFLASHFQYFLHSPFWVSSMQKVNQRLFCENGCLLLLLLWTWLMRAVLLNWKLCIGWRGRLAFCRHMFFDKLFTQVCNLCHHLEIIISNYEFQYTHFAPSTVDDYSYRQFTLCPQMTEPCPQITTRNDEMRFMTKQTPAHDLSFPLIVISFVFCYISFINLVLFVCFLITLSLKRLLCALKYVFTHFSYHIYNALSVLATEFLNNTIPLISCPVTAVFLSFYSQSNSYHTLRFSVFYPELSLCHSCWLLILGNIFCVFLCRFLI